MEAADVIVLHPHELDRAFYHMWLKGDSVTDAAQLRFAKLRDQYDAAQLYNFARAQYRTFELLMPFLQQPTGIREDPATLSRSVVNLLAQQDLVPLPPHVQSTVIEMYYEFDDAVLRELLGKKLSSRLRKDLEDIAEETGVSLASCRRQFDNMKHVYRLVEDTPNMATVQLIVTHFLMSNGLASKYARVIFISKNRLEISAHKKRLANLSFQDIEYCAGAFMEHWSTHDRGQPTSDLDTSFLRDVSDLKLFVSGATEPLDELRELLLPLVGKDSVVTKNKNNFRVIVRNIMSIGSGLRLERELKDIFSDIVEKIVEPCQKINWTTKDMDVFLQGIRDKFSNLTTIDASLRDRLAPAVTLYLNAIHACLMRLFPKLTLQ